MHQNVAVVVVAYDSDEVLPGLLRSVSTASATPPHIVVADNRPEESTRRIAEEAGAVYLPLENAGYGAAVNRARAALPAGIDWLLVCNPDLVLGAGIVDALVSRASADPRIGSIGPAILRPDGTVYPSARAIPSLRTGIGHALFANIWRENPWSAAYHGDRVERRDAGWLSGACLLVRMSAFDAVSGFDEGYFMYFEDVDLGDRLGRAGYRNVYEPSVSAVHLGAHSTQRHPERSARMKREHHRSAKRFLDARYSAPWFAPLRAAYTLALTVRARLATHRTG